MVRGRTRVAEPEAAIEDNVATLPGLDGRTVSLNDQKGKALLLFFWATW